MTIACALAVAACVRLVVPGCSARRLSPAPGAARPRERAGPVVVAVATAVVSMAVMGPGLGAVVAMGVLLGGRRWRSTAESPETRRRRATVVAQLPASLDLLVACLESGQPPVTALELVAAATQTPLAEDLAWVAARLHVASDPRVVWDDVARDPVLGAVGRAFRRAETSGVPVARVVAEVSGEQRRLRHAARRDQGRRVAVKTAAPLGLCFLPAFFLVGIVPTIVGVFSGLDLGL